MAKDSFILYCSQIDALSELNDAQLGRLIRYLVQFLQKGSQPSKRESNALLVAFNMLKLQIHIDLGKWETKKERQRKWVANKRSKNNVDDNGNVNVNVNANVNANENANENVITEMDSSSFIFSSFSEQEQQEEEKRRKYLLQLKDWWNNTLESEGADIPRVQRMTVQRARAYQSIAKRYSQEEIMKVVRRVCKSDYMNGRTREHRLATFDFVFQEENFLKILEGVYR